MCAERLTSSADCAASSKSNDSHQPWAKRAQRLHYHLSNHRMTGALNLCAIDRSRVHADRGPAQQRMPKFAHVPFCDPGSLCQCPLVLSAAASHPSSRRFACGRAGLLPPATTLHPMDPQRVINCSTSQQPEGSAKHTMHTSQHVVPRTPMNPLRPRHGPASRRSLQRELQMRIIHRITSWDI